MTYIAKVYKNGPDELVVGAGATLTIDDEATVDGITGVLTDSTTAELNTLADVTAGTVTASKALVVDANKHLDVVKTTALYIGASGSAVQVTATPAQLNAINAAFVPTAGAATPAVALRLGKTATEGLEIKAYEETIELTNAVTTNTTCAVPAGAVILSVQGNLEATITGDASGDDLLAKIGLGITGNEDKFAVFAALTKNTKADAIPDWAVSSGETIAIYALKTDGTTPCTEKFTGGSGQNVRVRVVYAVCNSLDDAA